MTQDQLNLVLKNLAAAKTANEVSLENIQRQLALGPAGSELGRLQALQALAVGQANHLDRIEIHLKAASITIAALSPLQQQQLDQLAAAIDQQIKNAFIVNATIETVEAAVNAAGRIENILGGHTGA